MSPNGRAPFLLQHSRSCWLTALLCPISITSFFLSFCLLSACDPLSSALSLFLSLSLSLPVTMPHFSFRASLLPKLALGSCFFMLFFSNNSKLSSWWLSLFQQIWPWGNTFHTYLNFSACFVKQNGKKTSLFSLLAYVFSLCVTGSL